MIRYDRLWVTLKSKGFTKYQLTKEYGVSKAQLHRLRHNQSVNTNTLDRLCNILECEVEDIMEHIQDGNRFKP